MRERSGLVLVSINGVSGVVRIVLFFCYVFKACLCLVDWCAFVTRLPLILVNLIGSRFHRSTYSFRLPEDGCTALVRHS